MSLIKYKVYAQGVSEPKLIDPNLVKDLIDADRVRGASIELTKEDIPQLKDLVGETTREGYINSVLILIEMLDKKGLLTIAL